MKTVKRILQNICEMVYLVSITLLGKIELGSFTLPKYQIVVSLFWMSGILRFMNKENDWKEELLDTVKDLFVAITIIPILGWIGGTYESELYEPISILVHFGVLLVIVWITRRAVKLSGKMAYFTHAVIPLIAIVLIRLGVGPVPAVGIAVILPEPVNYLLFLKKQKEISAEEKENGVTK